MGDEDNRSRSIIDAALGGGAAKVAGRRGKLTRPELAPNPGGHDDEQPAF